MLSDAIKILKIGIKNEAEQSLHLISISPLIILYVCFVYASDNQTVSLLFFKNNNYYFLSG